MLRVLERRFFSSASRLLQQETAQGAKTLQVKSSCPAGTPLNLDIKKGGKNPVALDDSEYPEWLWTVLEKEAQEKKLAEDPMKMRKVEIRKRSRANMKQNNFLGQL